jgi:hypothetical protein
MWASGLQSTSLKVQPISSRSSRFKQHSKDAVGVLKHDATIDRYTVKMQTLFCDDQVASFQLFQNVAQSAQRAVKKQTLFFMIM